MAGITNLIVAIFLKHEISVPILQVNSRQVENFVSFLRKCIAWIESFFFFCFQKTSKQICVRKNYGVYILESKRKIFFDYFEEGKNPSSATII